jgi:acyl carrier protein
MDERVRKVMAATFGVPESSIPANASPDNVTNWDSVRHMSLILALEEEFGVRFDEEQMAELVTFDLIRTALRDLQVKP